MISGATELLVHIGHPTRTSTSSPVYDPWFRQRGIDAAVVPVGVRPEHYPAFFRSVLTATNVREALVSTPHQVTTMALTDDVSLTAAIAGAAGAVRVHDDGTLYADQFDGAGFVQGARRRGFDPAGRSALVVGTRGVGAPIAASLAAAGISRLGLCDPDARASTALAERIRSHHEGLDVTTGGADPGGYDMVVHATPLGTCEDDPLPFDVAGLQEGTFVGDVVLGRTPTPLVLAARERGCEVQVGDDMLYEVVPAVLSFFGFGFTTPDEVRETAHPT